MISEIGLTNFLSFKNVKIDFMSRGNPLKYAMIYGENGSGKTNIIDAVSFLRTELGSLYRTEDQSTFSLDVPSEDETIKEINKHLDSVFSLIQKKYPDPDSKQLRKNCHSKSVDENTRLDYTFLINGNKAQYTVEFDQNGRIVFEQLKHRINKGFGTFYSVSWDGHDTKTNLNRELITGVGYKRSLQESIRKHWGNHTLLAIIYADRKKLMPDYIAEQVRKELLDFMDYISSLVIVDNDPKMFPSPQFQYFGTISSNRKPELDQAEIILNKFFTRLYSHTVRVEFKRKDVEENIQYKLVFHRKINGQIVEIDASQESTGTRHLLNLVHPILASVTGGTVFIDELDNGIHDKLLINLIEQVVPNIRGQLICTTHESLLLDAISPANAFVIQVDGNGNKNVCSISSLENVHRNNSVQKRFLGGRYMGIPIPTMLMLDEIAEDFHEGEIWRNL